MAWKRLTFILIPHSQENIRQVHISRTMLIVVMGIVFCVIGIMIFYIVGFEKKSFHSNETKAFEKKNVILMKQLTYYDTSLTEMSVKVDSLESLNKKIIEESNISEKDLQLKKNADIAVSEDGLTLPPQRVITIVDRMTHDASMLDKKITSLYDVCLKDTTFIRGIPSIRPSDGYISRDFGFSYDIYIKKEIQYPGIDINNEVGTPVVATGDGIIETMGYTEILGDFIIIDHQNGYKTQYAHLQSQAETPLKSTLREGDRVKRGQQISTIGRTGSSLRITSPHIMYSVYHHGVLVNPVDYFFASDFAEVSRG